MAVVDEKALAKLSEAEVQKRLEGAESAFYKLYAKRVDARSEEAAQHLGAGVGTVPTNGPDFWPSWV
jgi:hypothetical protein